MLAPRPHQLTALTDVERTLSQHDRAQLVMACGTGKTLVGRWLAERLAARSTLVLLPSLALVDQTVREWRRAHGWHFEALIVCSDPTTAEGTAERVGAAADPFADPSAPFWARQRVKVVTGAAAPAAVMKLLRHASTARPAVIFSTYHSSDTVAHGQAAAGVAGCFDLIVADEAHRLAGDSRQDFRGCLDDQRIRARRRLFMTATPVVIERSAVHSDADDFVDDGWCDPLTMGDEALFGPLAHRLTFAAAIEAGLLCDYQVLIVTRRLREVDVDQADRDTVALAAVLDAADRYGVTRLLSFHGRIRKARAFARELNVMSRLSDGRRLTAETVTADTSARERQQILNRLGQPMPDQVAVVTNARCLGEGLDVPAVDAVLFADPKTSVTDIAQAIGRVLRRSPGKTRGLVILPVALPADVDDDSALASSAFGVVWSVLRGLRAHDERLAGAVDEVTRGKGRTGRFGAGASRIDGLVSWIGDGVVDPELLAARLAVEVAAPWERFYATLRCYTERTGSARVSTQHHEEGLQLGRWVGHQRTMHRRGTLHPDRAARLELLTGWAWSTTDALWCDTAATLAAHHGLYGTVSADSLHDNGACSVGNRPLGPWAAEQRHAFRAGALDPGRARTLARIPSWSWQVLDDIDTAMLDALAEYVTWKGGANPPRDYIEDDLQLGAWVAAVRRRAVTGRLTRDLADALTYVAGGFRWETHDTTWRLYYAALLQFTRREGHARPVKGTVETLPDAELHIGQWVAVQRVRRRTGDLDVERSTALESLAGWTWDARKLVYGPPIDLGRRGARHGTGTGYTKGCRCQPCTEARRGREAARADRVRAGLPGTDLVDANPARGHLRILEARGASRKALARAAGVNVKTVTETLDGTLRRFTPDVAGRLTCLTIEAAREAALPGRHGGLVDPGPVWEQLDEMLAAGWPKAWIARELGKKSGAIQLRRHRPIGKQQAADIANLHRRLGGRFAPPRRHRQPMPTLAELDRAAQLEQAS